MENKENEDVVQQDAEQQKPVPAEAEQKPLTDDELYTQIQTEKLLKKKKVKRIVTFSSLCLAFVLAVCLIVLAVVPVSLKPRCAVDGFYEVQLYHCTQSMSTPEIDASFNNTENKDKYNMFLKKYNESFNTTYLSAIFNGSLVGYKIEEEYLGQKTNSNLDDERYEASYVPSALTNRDSYFVKLEYKTNQKFVKQNGQVYKSTHGDKKLEDGTVIWDGTLDYQYIFVEVNQTRTNHVTFYVLAKSPYYKDNQYDEEHKTCNYHLITVEVKADTYPIYNAWNSLIKEN